MKLVFENVAYGPPAAGRYPSKISCALAGPATASDIAEAMRDTYARRVFMFNILFTLLLPTLYPLYSRSDGQFLCLRRWSLALAEIGFEYHPVAHQLFG